MSTLSNILEASAIDAAYDAHLQALFQMLITNLGDQTFSHLTDRQCVAKFTTGLNIAKRARQLA
jgi:hypothetical protein